MSSRPTAKKPITASASVYEYVNTLATLPDEPLQSFHPHPPRGDR